MTPEQTALLARLEGFEEIPAEKGYLPRYKKGNIYYEVQDLTDYDDERNLMPLAFDKCRLSLFPYIYNSATLEVTEWCVVSNYFNVTPKMYYDKYPKIAIQQALLAIAREKYGE